MTTTPLEDARERLDEDVQHAATAFIDLWYGAQATNHPMFMASSEERRIAAGWAFLSALAEKEGKSGSIPVLPSWTAQSAAITELRALSERATQSPLCWEQCGDKVDAPVIGVACLADDPDSKSLSGRLPDSDADGRQIQYYREDVAYQIEDHDGAPASANAAFLVACWNYVREILAAADLPCAPNAHPESGVTLEVETYRKALERIDTDNSITSGSIGPLCDVGFSWGWGAARSIAHEALQCKADGDAVPGAEGDRRDAINPIDPSQTGGLTELRALSEAATPGEWELQDGSSWRRIGTRMGQDGNVLCPYNARSDNHPDLCSGRGEDIYANLRLIVAAVNYVRQALSSTPPAPNGEVEIGWQPIETAPKDGTPILAWCVHPNARWAGDINDWAAPVVTQWTTFNDGGWTWHGMAGAFTHWRPLPSPPSPSGAQT